MIEEDIRALCEKLRLGAPRRGPERVFGGLLHTMYKIETDAGAYAVKAMNPLIMRREHVVENLLFAEQVAKTAYRNGFPMVPAIGDGGSLHLVHENYYMAFAWAEAKSLSPAEVTAAHCGVIGGLLARLHRMDCAELAGGLPRRAPPAATDWQAYAASGADWAAELSEIWRDLAAWEAEILRAAPEIEARRVFSHRDMDCKNVLWDRRGAPLVIDWESAGAVNPLHELLDAALAWSGGDADDFDVRHFEALVTGYLDGGGVIADDVSAVLRYALLGRLHWLAYSIRRSLGIESGGPEEQALGTSQVFGTIRAIRRCAALLPVCEAAAERCLRP